jgi:hypothetical protein
VITLYEPMPAIACLPQAPRNSGSRLIRGAMRQLRLLPTPSTASAVRSTKPRGFVEIGPSQGGRRVQVFHRGRFISERSARRRFGTASAPGLAAMGLRVESTPRRTRYLASREGA